MSDLEVQYRPASSPDLPVANARGFAPGTTVLPQGSVHSPGGLPLPCDIVFDRDVAVAMRDGTTIYVDVFRPVGEQTVPAIVPWSPYGKQGGFWTLDIFPGRAGVAADSLSGLQKWEAPDPAYWCARGYAIVNPDPRGVFNSAGDIQMFSPQEARDGYDLIEWIANQPWSSGKVGMAGNSWLAVSQWMIAAEQPPHLAAIAPWEGFNDFYRDMIAPGGIPTFGFSENIIVNNFGRNRTEDLVATFKAQPLMNELWERRHTDTSGITIPAYVAASYTNLLHTRGTFNGWRALPERNRWLRIHNSLEWPDFYEYQDDLHRFFDWALKGQENGWQDTPRVRMAVLDPGHDDEIEVAEDAFPPTRAVATAFHLDAATESVVGTAPEREACLSYDAKTGSAVFIGDFGDLVLAGPMKLRLWVEAQGHDEMDLFVGVSKQSADGVQLTPDWFPGVPSPGARGQQRVSHRALDADHSTDLIPFQKHDKVEPLSAGEIVSVDIEIWPMAMRWHAGEKLRIEISGHDLQVPIPGVLPERSADNEGRHVIHTGGRYGSYLVAPVVGESK
ncbi:MULTISPECIES: CocE/NonD family hydrolase [Mycolicibacterium]|uniref:Putative hydrolase, CocE/NonD family n=2 Tax=Mycolicibacterium senegalense TaxID=1796 RepID=A0A378W5V0_9MYCO|nr:MULTISPECIES: CocE/NonD family hydrolase [Mycolicibacterium]MCV7336063.1 CocE/NonD family hydrolase [Mycolicibacterium senegalense]MDR7287931.1 putative acyl esterase [Mycolicibacterium senegalense]QZA27122.1 CocE/NonD family hydrolase [Mycolicibacterium senegalense]CDP86646.1 acyl esterase [Mycolicibacterium farcinogenes]SUA28493.1 putative hydrolase, CocE/NonD family [Mycolicibacterium senegalense]